MEICDIGRLKYIHKNKSKQTKSHTIRCYKYGKSVLLCESMLY